MDKLSETEMHAFCGKLAVAGVIPVLYSTWHIVETIVEENIPGDLAECGVMAGAQPAVMAWVLEKHGISPQDKQIHLFDSFQGIPEAGPRDTEQPGIGPKNPAAQGRLISSGISSVSVQQVQANLQKWGCNMEYFQYHPGWFQESLPNVADGIGELALLRVDVDLYESTKFCYEYLYGKVVKGGFVIDDDWGMPENIAPPCREAVLEYLQETKQELPPVTAVPEQPTTVWWRK